MQLIHITLSFANKCLDGSVDGKVHACCELLGAYIIWWRGSNIRWAGLNFSAPLALQIERIHYTTFSNVGFSLSLGQWPHAK